MTKAIVIGGGVGPMAGVGLHKAIIENTKTDGTDQSHFEVLHLSRSFDIPDRTEYLVGIVDQNPAEGMARTFAMADAALALSGQKAVGGIPCNTFHAPVIFTRFLELMEEQGTGIKVLSMIDETTEMIRELVPRAEAIGLLSTTGTRKAGTYAASLGATGMTVLECPESTQPELHDAIYNRGWGLKAVSPATSQAVATVESFALDLISQGAQALILGCTELGLALPGRLINEVPLIEPVVALARGLVREADPGKLRAIAVL